MPEPMEAEGKALTKRNIQAACQDRQAVKPSSGEKIAAKWVATFRQPAATEREQYHRRHMGDRAAQCSARRNDDPALSQQKKARDSKQR